MRRSAVYRGKFGLAVVIVGTALMATAVPASGQGVNGSSGSGDPFFPLAGNGGYDVSHYSLTIDYDQPPNVLSGDAVIEARATQNLRRFNLDLRDFYPVSAVTVDGLDADFAQLGEQELQIQPTRLLRAG